jgi:hypothetical protein
VVGVDIPAGTFRAPDVAFGCYWERLRGFGGTLDEIIANDFTDIGQIVTIEATDAGFSTDPDCGTWTSDLSPLRAPSAPLPPGTWLVGSEITPGTWRAPGGDGCYWERLRGFSGELRDIIANDFTSAPNPVVTIAPGDVGFRADRDCGTWALVG